MSKKPIAFVYIEVGLVRVAVANVKIVWKAQRKRCLSIINKPGKDSWRSDRR
jgi:hypothetical protein